MFKTDAQAVPVFSIPFLTLYTSLLNKFIRKVDS